MYYIDSCFGKYYNDIKVFFFSIFLFSYFLIFHSLFFFIFLYCSVRADGDVRKNNFNEPTLEDKFDKEKLPAVLQVKNFGKRGRTKYTHLADQDTTKFNERLKVDERLRQSYQSKIGGVGSLDHAGRINKKAREDEI